MGSLTASMTRLRSEIVALRTERQNLIQNLGQDVAVMKQDVAAMKAGFRRVHQDMARRTKMERQGFVKALGHEVATLRAGFRRSHQDMARKTKAERQAALKNLKQTVGTMRRELALDLAGAHRAWFGPSLTERQAKAQAELRLKAGAEQRAAEQRAAEQRAKEEAERERLAAEAKAKEEAARQKAVHKEEAAAGKK